MVLEDSSEYIKRHGKNRHGEGRGWIDNYEKKMDMSEGESESESQEK